LCNNIILSGFFWEGYTTDVNKFVAKCEICNADENIKKIKPPPKIILDEGPRFRYVVDIWELPESLAENSEYIYILDCVDHFSKFLNAYLLKNKTMDLVISKIKLFIVNNGKCKIIQSDNGKEFDNIQMKIFCENSNIKFIKSSPYHPETNGTVEVIHRYENEYLLKRKTILRDDFDIGIALDEFIIHHNNKKHSITGFKPCRIRDTEDENLIKTVLNNIIKSLSKKLEKGDKIKKGCFVLISNKISKKGGVYKEKNVKGKKKFRLPGIFQKFINVNTALIKIRVKFKNEFIENDEIKCKVGNINWVDELVYNYFIDKFNDNTFIEERN
jgi:hypothetical protein